MQRLCGKQVAKKHGSTLMTAVEIIGGPAAEPLSRDEAKAHLRVD